MSRGRLSIWAPLRPGAYLRRPVSELPFPLEEPGCRLYEFARQRLFNGLEVLGLGPGDEVLVPAYNHGSEVEVLSRAGVTCRFFDSSEDLAPDEHVLERLLGPSTRALYLIHHLGFPQAAPRWRRWCDERGLLLIEDVAMAWLARLDGRPLGSWGDLAIFSPWKTYGLPDLGAVLCDPAPEPMPLRRRRARGLLRGHAAWLAGRSGLAASTRRLRRPPEPFSPEVAFAVGNSRQGASAISYQLLRRLHSSDTAAVRRANYGRLLEAVGEHVPPPFDALPEGACPFALPVWTEDKPAFIAELRSNAIAGLDIWSVPHPAFPAEEYPRAAARRASTVGLPVHQELGEADIERIAETASTFLAARPERPPGVSLVGGAR